MIPCSPCWLGCVWYFYSPSHARNSFNHLISARYCFPLIWGNSSIYCQTQSGNKTEQNYPALSAFNQIKLKHSDFQKARWGWLEGLKCEMCFQGLKYFLISWHFSLTYTKRYILPKVSLLRTKFQILVTVTLFYENKSINVVQTAEKEKDKCVLLQCYNVTMLQ